MIHKTIPARRFERRRHIGRKRNIERHIMGMSEHFLSTEPLGYLDKNKVHCSCPLCACKSTTDRGVRTNSKRGYRISDIRKLNRMKDNLTDYYTA